MCLYNFFDLSNLILTLLDTKKILFISDIFYVHISILCFLIYSFVVYIGSSKNIFFNKGHGIQFLYICCLSTYFFQFLNISFFRIFCSQCSERNIKFHLHVLRVYFVFLFFYSPYFLGNDITANGLNVINESLQRIYSICWADGKYIFKELSKE